MKNCIIIVLCIVMSIGLLSCPESGTPPYSLGLTMVDVPTGTFQNDSDGAGHESTISAFMMSAYEITRTQFQAIMDIDPSDPDYSTGMTDPVQTCNWYHVIAFCNKLSIAESLTPVYAVSGITDWADLAYDSIPDGSADAAWDAVTVTWSADGYRLPTEMEWMWAAMGATSDRTNGYTGTGTNTTGYTKAYAGSTEHSIDYYAWFDAISGSKSHPVGTTGTTGYANELGLYDMSGNVWEWCWDWYDSTYPPTPEVDYRGPGPGTTRVLRGGSWNVSNLSCTVAKRHSFQPYHGFYTFGFRVVRS
jgi:formylglycine-generating enzyme required for sulfatase activity